MSKSKDPNDLLKRAYSLETDEDTKSLYRDWAESYDATMLDGLSYVTPRKTASLLADFLENRDLPILDVGSGTGLAGECLWHQGFTKIDALDYSPQMLSVASHREVDGKKIYASTILADLNQKIPLKSESFTGMICTGTFTHAHVGPECLDELFRILVPGGFFACTVHKDIWDNAGFSTKVKKLASNGILRTKGMIMDIYFENDEEPQGWYIVWEKL